MKKNLIVMQDGNKDCGAACLLSIIRYFGGDISLDRIVDKVKTTKEGTNFYNISKAATQFNLVAKCFQADDIEKIKNIAFPFIAQITNKNSSHFVVVYKIKDNKITIMDPSKGKTVADIFDFLSTWTGYIMLFEKIGNMPEYKNEKVLNKIIRLVLIKNIRTIIFLIVLSIIFTILSCLLSLYSQIIFDKIINTNINNLIVITAFFSILFIIKNITNFIRNHLVIYLNQKLDISIILNTYSKVILLPYSFYKNKTTAEVLSRINDLSYTKNFISKIIVTIFLDLLTFIVAFLIIYTINKKILFYLMLVDITYILILILFSKVIKSNTIINQENTASINNQIIESVSAFETIKGLNIEDNTILKFSKLYSKSLNHAYHTEKINNVIFLLKELIEDIGILIINFLIIKSIMEHQLTIGNYMTITFLSGYLIYPFINLINLSNEYHYVKNTIKRGNDLLEYDEDKIYEEEKLTINGNIKFKHLKFTFNNKHHVLRDINFFVRDKEKVIILGPSGCGKSTIMKILYKYYEIDRGNIYVNNYDLNDYSISDIRKHITYISQNEMLFTGTIRDNILLGRNVSEVEFLNVCSITLVDKIIKDNILGYDYLIEEGGANLSGGQKQRIILARSLLKNSKIIMIDEGLNQIDIKLEREILTSIFNYYYDKTFIIISHRKANIDLYDRVIKIGAGIVKEIEEKKR